ncbi:MAG: Minf_1886 family protein [Opitutales bacterium]
MPNPTFSEVIEQIRQTDARFAPGAYHFVRQALDYTLKRPERQNADGTSKHVSGQELLDGIREYALDQFGPLSLIVLEDWGVRRCEDFGEIVFNLVDFGVLGKTENDRREDFAGAYTFADAFLSPFQPARPRAGDLAREKNMGAPASLQEQPRG